jgi:hypothetical protein
MAERFFQLARKRVQPVRKVVSWRRQGFVEE